MDRLKDLELTMDRFKDLDLSLDRFEDISSNVELVEEYRREGYHPVRLHDVFNERYEVTGKISYGSSSTVWQAKDKVSEQLVALKILKADDSKENNELSMLLHLSRSTLKHPGKEYVIQLLDYFEHVGPNGTHLCLVLPFMVINGSDIVLSFKPTNTEYVRSISWQLSLGLDYLHAVGIIHCDLHPQNIMFSVDGVTQSEITSKLNTTCFCPVVWRKGVQVDDSAPKALITPQMPCSELHNQILLDPKVMIGDLGHATWKGTYEKPILTPLPSRAPELINKSRWDASVDIWALGCVIFDLATKHTLFPVMGWGLTDEEIDEDHRAYINEILNSGAESFSRHVAKIVSSQAGPFGISSDISPVDIPRFASFLLMMLQIDQQKRAPTSKLLVHPFMRLRARGNMKKVDRI